MRGTVAAIKEANPFPKKQHMAIQQLKCDLQKEGKSILDQIQAAGRDATEKEKVALDNIEAEIDKCNDEISARDAYWQDQIEQLNNLEGGGAQSDNQVWKDEEGNRIHVLAPGQKLANLPENARQRNHGGLGGAPSVNFGDVVRGMVTGHWDESIQAADHTIGRDGSGGYLVGSSVASEVIDLARNQSVLMRAGARTMQMRTGEVRMMRITKDPEVQWVGEAKKIPMTESAFGLITLRARKMGTLVSLSREMIEDAPNAQEIINRQFSAQIALEIDRAGLLGSGKGEEPRGIFAHPDVQETDVSATLDYDVLLDAMQKIEDKNGNPAAAIYSPKSKNTLAKLKSNEGNYLAPPVDITDRINRLVTKQIGDDQVTVGDFSQVMFGIRGGIRIESSIHPGFDTDTVHIRAMWRGDIQFALPNHIVRLINIS